ncbi:hypothetical protein ZWY2020_034115 [Hordeum vulgare]|nr:hypothetical protein ZWY2020_034115 [Hordeum vulgare]
MESDGEEEASASRGGGEAEGLPGTDGGGRHAGDGQDGRLERQLLQARQRRRLPPRRQPRHLLAVSALDSLDTYRNGGVGGAEGDSTAFPAWPPSAGGIRRQHSVEYWMMASLQQGGAAAAEAVRVRDPAAAEAFFVPFFS